MKKCNKCGETKPLSEFYKDCKALDGYRGRCKLCQNATIKCWREANPDRKAAIDKAWYEANKERHATVTKVWREANLEQVAARKKAWGIANPDKVRANLERAKERWPEKFAARKAANHAITAGYLVRQPCEVCGALEVHGHHDDYSQPLAVRWLCHKHHMEYHAQQRRSQATFYAYPVSYALDPTPFYAYPENYRAV